MELGVQMLVANSLPWTQNYARPAHVDEHFISLEPLSKVCKVPSTQNSNFGPW